MQNTWILIHQVKIIRCYEKDTTHSAAYVVITEQLLPTNNGNLQEIIAVILHEIINHAKISDLAACKNVWLASYKSGQAGRLIELMVCEDLL